MSRLIVMVSVYCLFRFRNEWRSNLASKEYRSFLYVSLAYVIFMALYHIFRGEEFNFARTLLTSLLYLTCIPRKFLSLKSISRIVAIGGGFTGLFSLYDVYILGAGRAGEIAFNAIPFATFCAVIFIVSLLSFLFLEKSPFAYLIYGIGVIGSLTGVMLSETRGIWLALGATLLIFLMFSFKRILVKSNRRYLLLGGFILMSIPFIFHSQFSDSFQRSSTEITSISEGNMDTSVGIRLQIWQRGVNYIGLSPWLGVSSEAYPSLLDNDVKSQNVTALAANFGKHHFHNQYIDMTVRTGVISLVFLLFWLIFPVLLLLRRKGTFVRLASVGVLAILLVGSLTDVPFNYTHMIYLYTMLIGSFLLCRDDEIN